MFALAENKSEMVNYTDGQLAGLVSCGNADAFAELTARYMSAIRAKAAPFHSSLLETDDLCQEGLLGLLNAARTFDSGNGANFRTYAGVCIANRMIMAYRASVSNKNIPLNHFISLSEEGGTDLYTRDCASDPEAMLADSENFSMMWGEIEQLLSGLELRVLTLYLNGCSYREISENLGISRKAADNALQRIRLKLKTHLAH